MTKSEKAASKLNKDATKRDKGKFKKSEVLSTGLDESSRHDAAHVTHDDLHKQPREELSKKQYEKELKKLFLELIKLQEWVTTTRAFVVVTHSCSLISSKKSKSG